MYAEAELSVMRTGTCARSALCSPGAGRRPAGAPPTRRAMRAASPHSAGRCRRSPVVTQDRDFGLYDRRDLDLFQLCWRVSSIPALCGLDPCSHGDSRMQPCWDLFATPMAC